MTTYAEDRARRIAEGPTGKATYSGGLSRQARRARQREYDKDPRLSYGLDRLLNRVAGMNDGAIFFSRSAYNGLPVRYEGKVGERRKPSADYSPRYKTLLPMLTGA